MKERKAYVVLVLISLCLSLAAFVAGVSEIDSNNHKFCQIIRTALKTKVPKPAHPKQDPSRERAYEGYINTVKLGKDLGCIP